MGTARAYYFYSILIDVSVKKSCICLNYMVSPEEILNSAGQSTFSETLVSTHSKFSLICITTCGIENLSGKSSSFALLHHVTTSPIVPLLHLIQI
jgi:hypothetical protein